MTGPAMSIGANSPPPPRRQKSLFTDDLGRLEIWRLRRRGLLQPGAKGVVVVHAKLGRPLSAGFAVVTALACRPLPKLHIRHSINAMPDSSAGETTVTIIRRSTQGGTVFRCPTCNEPVSILYMAPRLLACARCLRLRWPLRTSQEKAHRQLMQLRRKMGQHDEDGLPGAPLQLPPRARRGWWSKYARNVKEHQRLTRQARLSTTILDELLDALDGPLPEWVIASQRPRDLRVAILREKRGGRKKHGRLPPWRLQKPAT